MATLTKTPLKNGYFLYQVVLEDGSVKSQRKSKREYVACTSDGCMYFGRKDLIYKGEHGRKFNQVLKVKERLQKEPEKMYKEYVKIWGGKDSYEEYIKYETRWAEGWYKCLTDIAYLK